MSVLVVIPARYSSSRFPGKPLAMLNGKPMIQHVYEGASLPGDDYEVVVATDDQRIADAIRKFGGRSVMTSPLAQSGTERVAEVARIRNEQIVINVQGDEPLIHPDMVIQLADFLSHHQAVPMASLMIRLTRPEDITSPNVVKVVVDLDGFALYFSRAPIPFERANSATGQLANSPTRQLANHFYKHLGIYGYQRHFLLQFPSLERTPLEQLEQLEQLRALEHGYRIKLLETTHDTIGVDTPEDLNRVLPLLKKVTSDR